MSCMHVDNIYLIAENVHVPYTRRSKYNYQPTHDVIPSQTLKGGRSTNLPKPQVPDGVPVYAPSAKSALPSRNLSLSTTINLMAPGEG